MTIYFTSQLVRNDNKREKRTKIESLKIYFRNRLGYAAKQDVLLQKTGISLRKKYPKNQKEIVDSYEEFYASQDISTRFVSPEKFIESLRNGEPNEN